jgi:hypothetical protein
VARGGIREGAILSLATKPARKRKERKGKAKQLVLFPSDHLVERSEKGS